MSKQSSYKQTGSQTVGPFFSYALTPEAYGRTALCTNRLTTDQTQGDRIRVRGRVLDGEGNPVADALVEIWQANAAGRYAHGEDGRDDVPADPAFRGFGRAGTDANGAFEFETVKPGRVPGRGNTLQAPHINVIVFARGMLSHAYTRLYFEDEAAANEEDAVLASIEAGRRPTLVARRQETGGGTVYGFDIVLQGDKETVFFDA